MKKIILASLFLIFVGCTAPQGFVARPAGWSTIQMRNNIVKEKAWSTLVSVVSENYDIETLDKDSGYLRTAWLFSGNSATRITAKLEENNTTRIKVDSKYYDILSESWIEGYNTSTTEKVKQDLSGRLR
ncbi:MAG: hypothetical protein Q4A58_06945 [Fusobacterium sp.]|uniref:hypothetical protein n=1 Tax=Fusobacterium sp. TaxID=68766 RepID=UPI0026DA8D4B|nr:hypothetical protein [Fusobacterium sp.]MDO4691013.1 hypothetical protein [Fusobacterium sp.]